MAIFDTIIQIVVYMIIFFVLLFAILYPIFLIYDRIKDKLLKDKYLKEKQKGGNDGTEINKIEGSRPSTYTGKGITGIYSTTGRDRESNTEGKQTTQTNVIQREFEGRRGISESTINKSGSDKTRIKLT